MSFPTSEDTENFLRLFFSKPNKILFEDIQTNPHKIFKFLRNSIQWLYLEKGPQFVILPYVIDKTKPTLWCALSFNHEQANLMRAFLKSFIGDTYSDLRKHGTIKSNNPLGKAINNYIGEYGMGMKFQGDFSEVTGALQLLNNLRKKSPAQTIRRHITSGNLLRSFYYALEVGDRTEANRLVQLMRQRKFLDATNLIFLDVQIKANFQEWNEIFNNHQFSTLLLVKRPKVVTQSLIQSIYNSKFLKEFEQRSDIDGAIVFFREEIFPQVANLFISWINSSKPEVLKLWMIKYLSGLDDDELLYERLVSTAKVADLDDDFWNKLILYKHNQTNTEKATEPTVYQSDAYDLMLMAFDEENLYTAFEYAKYAPDNPKKASVLFHCALKLGDAEIFNLYLKVKEKLPTNVRLGLDDQIEKSLKFYKESHWATEKTPLPSNWIELIDRINCDEEFAKNKALKIAEEVATEWKIDDLLKIHNAIILLDDALSSSRTSLSENIFKKTLPHLLSFLWKDKIHQPEFTPIYNTIFDTFATTDNLNRGELITITELVHSMLSVGIPEKRYQEIINGIIHILPYYRSPYTINCLIDLVDTVLQYPVLSKNDIINLLSHIKDILEQIGNINDVNESKHLFNSFCEYVSISDLKFLKHIISTDEQKSIWSYYTSKKIGIYTLTDGAATRAENFLQNLDLSIKTYHNNDHAGTTSLKNLAQSVDFLVIVAGSAKHAAYYTIKQNLGENITILYPLGKGSSSILYSLREHATKYISL